MKIVVTGASGFIGGAIVHHLASDSSLEIVAMGRSVSTTFDKYLNVEYVRQDLCKEKSTLECDVCIHSAGLANDSSTAEAFHRHNVLATSALIDRLVNCKQFIFISSSSVYAFDGVGEVSEDTAVVSDRQSAYGKSKLLAENEVLKSKIKSIYILRPRAVYGEGDTKIVPRIIKMVKNNKMILPKELCHKSSLTNIHNLQDVVLYCFKNQKSTRTIWNVCDDRYYNLREVFVQIGEANQANKIKVTLVPKTIIAFLIKLKPFLPLKLDLTKQSLDYLTGNSALSLDRLKEESGLELEYTFEDYRRDLINDK